jgi:hypothetical protein
LHQRFEISQQNRNTLSKTSQSNSVNARKCLEEETKKLTRTGINPASVMTTVTSSGLETSYNSDKGERLGGGVVSPGKRLRGDAIDRIVDIMNQTRAWEGAG